MNYFLEIGGLEETFSRTIGLVVLGYFFPRVRERPRARRTFRNVRQARGRGPPTATDRLCLEGLYLVEPVS